MTETTELLTLRQLIILLDGHAVTRRSLFLTYTLGSIATNTNSNIILATDFLIDLSLVIRLIRLKKIDPLNLEKQIDFLQDLVLNEMIEFIIPLVHLLVFFSAYFGPNSGLIRVIKYSIHLKSGVCQDVILSSKLALGMVAAVAVAIVLIWSTQELEWKACV